MLVVSTGTIDSCLCMCIFKETAFFFVYLSVYFNPCTGVLSAFQLKVEILSKTKVLTLANNKGLAQSIEPIKTETKHL